MIIGLMKKIPSSLSTLIQHYGGKVLMQSKAFNMLITKAFDICDTNSDGKIDETELYTGLILVHLNLAKYAGPSACYPPSRSVCRNIVIKADIDHNGTIDRNEFTHIVGILSAQIMLRMLVYYIVLILFVPIAASKIITLISIQRETYIELCTYQIVSIGLFFIAIPLLWNYIDAYYAAPAVGINSLDATNTSDDTNVINREEELSLPLSSQQQSRRRRKQKQDDIEL